MTHDEARAKIVQHWLRKADAALASAQSEIAAKRYEFAANRIYYACFYSATAVLLEAGTRFVKHSGVRAAVHQALVKAGRLDAKWGKAYDQAFNTRQAADYLELFEVEEAQVLEGFELAKGFVSEMKRLSAAGKSN